MPLDAGVDKRARVRRPLKPVWVSVNDAVRLTSLCHDRLYELMADGTLKWAKVGKRRLISYASIETLGQ